MLQRIALLAIAAPRRVIAAALLIAVAAGIFGIPVATSLSASGFQDPTSESSRATQLLTEKFGQGDVQMLITVTAPDNVLGGPARTVGLDVVDRLQRSPHVANVTSAWTAPPGAAAELVSKDGKSGLIVARHHRRRERRRRPTPRRCPMRWPGQPRRHHRARGRGRDGERADHRRNRSAICC